MKLSKILIALSLTIASVAASTSSSLATTNVNAQATASVNVRTGPSTNFDILDTLYRGEPVQTHECRQGWCFISHAGPDGWVAARYLLEVSTPSDNYIPSRPTTPWPLRPAPAPSYDAWPGPQIPWPFKSWPGNPNPRHPMPTEPQYQACDYTGTHYRGRTNCMTPSRSTVHLGSSWSRNTISLWAD